MLKKQTATDQTRSKSSTPYAEFVLLSITAIVSFANNGAPNDTMVSK